MKFYRMIVKQRGDYLYSRLPTDSGLAIDLLMLISKSREFRRGASTAKLLVSLVVLGILTAMGGFIYFGWQGADMSGVSGREGISKGQSSIGAGYVDIANKVQNALNENKEVTLTESELNQYLAKNVKMKQAGWMKNFSSIKGVYVDLKPDVMEVFIEREIAQYAKDGTIKTDVFKPFNHTVSMKLKIFTVVDDTGKTTRKTEFPGGSIGKAPAPGMMVMVVKDSFDQLAEHFRAEIDLGYEQMTKMKILEGKIVLDPRVNTRVVTR